MLCKRLQLLRTEKGLTKKQMAEYLRIAESTYGKYELGKREPSLEIIIKLSKFFNVSVDYLLGLTDAKNTEEIMINLNQHSNKKWTKEELREIEIFKEFLKFRRDVKKNEQDT